MNNEPKLLSVQAVSIQINMEAIEDAEKAGSGMKDFFNKQKDLDADIQEIADNNFSQLLDSTNCSTDAVTDYYFGDVRPKIIKLAHLRDVIDKIDKGEITMSKGAEILNQVAANYLNKMSVITNYNM